MYLRYENKAIRTPNVNALSIYLYRGMALPSLVATIPSKILLPKEPLTTDSPK